MPTLIEVESALALALERLDEEPDETAIAHALEASLAAEDKRDRVVLWLKQGAALESWIDDEIEALKAKKATLRRRREWLEGQVLICLDAIHQGKPLIGRVHKIQKIQNPPRVELLDDSETAVHNMPSDYIRIKTTVEPDKRAIKEAIEAGNEVPNARLSPGSWRLKIT